jgi:phosphomannomutase
MFKAYDIRTKSSRLTPELARRLIMAIGAYVSETLEVSAVVLGRDARLAAPALMESALEILPAMGLDVIVNPLQGSTCQFYFACMRNPSAAAIMFTASHNPGDYIGIKLLGPGMRSIALDSGPGGGITGILARYLDDRPQPVSARHGRTLVRRYLDEYIEYSMKLAGVRPGELAGTPLFLDFLCGAAGTEISEALGVAGAKLDMRNLVPDGFFPAGDPNPLIEQSVRPSREKLAKGGCLCGFIYDGDGDRMDIMDSKGGQLAPSFNLTALLPDILATYRRASENSSFGGGSAPWRPQIYSDVKANPLAMKDQASCGAGVHIIRNGHSFIKEALRANLINQYLLASEESAHYYMNFPLDPEDWEKGFAATENTLYFTLLTAKVWASHPERYERAIARQATLARAREWACHFKDERLMTTVLAEVEEVFAGRGLSVIRSMEDGSDLDATLMRKGLPGVITAASDLEGPWYQVAQRISRSEEGMTRWEVVSNSEAACREAVAAVRSVTDRYVERGVADYE